jgi:hypothetical protein
MHMYPSTTEGLPGRSGSVDQRFLSKKLLSTKTSAVRGWLSRQRRLQWSTLQKGAALRNWVVIVKFFLSIWDGLKPVSA